jgi:hypothetical protein
MHGNILRNSYFVKSGSVGNKTDRVFDWLKRLLVGKIQIMLIGF